MRTQRLACGSHRPPPLSPPDAQLSAVCPSSGYFCRSALRKPRASRAVHGAADRHGVQGARPGPGDVPGAGRVQGEPWKMSGSPEAPPCSPTDSGFISSRIQQRHLLVISSL